MPKPDIETLVIKAGRDAPAAGKLVGDDIGIGMDQLMNDSFAKEVKDKIVALVGATFSQPSWEFLSKLFALNQDKGLQATNADFKPIVDTYLRDVNSENFVNIHKNDLKAIFDHEQKGTITFSDFDKAVREVNTLLSTNFASSSEAVKKEKQALMSLIKEYNAVAPDITPEVRDQVAAAKEVTQQKMAAVTSVAAMDQISLFIENQKKLVAAAEAKRPWLEKSTPTFDRFKDFVGNHQEVMEILKKTLEKNLQNPQKLTVSEVAKMIELIGKKHEAALKVVAGFKPTTPHQEAMKKAAMDSLADLTKQLKSLPGMEASDLQVYKQMQPGSELNNKFDGIMKAHPTVAAGIKRTALQIEEVTEQEFSSTTSRSRSSTP